MIYNPVEDCKVYRDGDVDRELIYADGEYFIPHIDIYPVAKIFQSISLGCDFNRLHIMKNGENYYISHSLMVDFGEHFSKYEETLYEVKKIEAIRIKHPKECVKVIQDKYVLITGPAVETPHFDLEGLDVNMAMEFSQKIILLGEVLAAIVDIC